MNVKPKPVYLDHRGNPVKENKNQSPQENTHELVTCPVCFGTGYIQTSVRSKKRCHCCIGNKQVFVTIKNQ